MNADLTRDVSVGGQAHEKVVKTIFSYAHPIFWAPFTLVSDGGSAAPGR